jgi:hypothetical protein
MCFYDVSILSVNLQSIIDLCRKLEHPRWHYGLLTEP